MKSSVKRFSHHLQLSLGLFFTSVLFHYPRLFFIADESGRLTGKPSLFDNYPILCKWDCQFYHYLANSSPLLENKHLAAFFPLFPLSLKYFSDWMPHLSLNALSVILSNCFSLLAIALAIALGSQLWPRPLLHRNRFFTYPWSRGGLLLGLGLACYPYSQFFSYGYSEPLFLCLLLGVILQLVKEQWLWASLGCGLAAITRPQGIWVLLAFFGWLGFRFIKKTDLKQSRSPSKALYPAYFVSAMGPFIAFLIWQKGEFGSYLAFLNAQSGWGRSFSLGEGLKNHLPQFEFGRILIWLGLFSTYSCSKRKHSIGNS